MRVMAMRVRAGWRQRTGALVTFTLLVALSGTVVLTAFAGARRTHSVPSRFIRADGSPDAVVALQALDSMHGVQEVRRLPEVDRAGVAVQLAALPYAKNQSYLPLLAPTDNIFGTSIWRGLVVDGRRPDPTAADEILLSEAHARLLGAHVGDYVPLLAFDQRQADDCLRSDQPPPECKRLSTTPRLSVRVVGVVRTAIDLNARTQDISFSMLSRAFFEQHRTDIAWNPLLMVHLRRAATPQSFADHVRATLGTTPADIQLFNGAAVVDAVNVLSTGLLLFALVAAVAAAFAIGQTIVRQVGVGASDRNTLAALGVTRIGRGLDAAGSIGVAGIAGALLALGGAYGASTLMPIALARRAEARRGLDLDATVLVLGALALIVFVIVTAVVAATALARRRAVSRAERPTLAARLTTAPIAPSAAIGLRNAFGGRRDAVPVRSAFGGIAAATAGVVAVLVFGAGLHHLVRTPELYGWGWDAMDIQYSDQNRARLLADRDVADIALLERRARVTVAGRPTFLLAITPVRGAMQPAIIAGRSPQRVDEVAVGRDTLTTARAKVGDSIVLKGNEESLRARVVGIAAFATSDDGDPLAEGAVVTPDGRRRLVGAWTSNNDSAGQRNYAVRFRPGVDRARALARLEQLVPPNNDGQSAFSAPSPPAEVVKLRQVESLPRMLAFFLAALGLLAVAHASFVGVRRRARDFAVLRAMGFRPGDVRVSVASEAFALAACGALIGIPLGVVVGRFAWRKVAAGVGVLIVQRVPIGALVAALPVAVILALGAALVPGRRAARVRPSQILRTE